jgi:purine nucleosidase
MNWIIDTDAGVDDAIAIALPFTPGGRFSNIHVRAFTTVAGNVPLHKVNVNVGALLDVLDLSTPYFSGCDRPMVEPYADAADFHGADGLGDAGLSVTNRSPMAEHAALALVRLSKLYAGDLTLIALGPLTNVAMAANLDPDFASRVSHLVVMGGAWKAVGNQSSAAEFNIAVDPESAQVAFDRFNHITLVPWEVSLDGMYPYDRFATLGDSARARWVQRMSALGCKKLAEHFGLPGFPLPDPLAVVAAIAPETITGHKRCRIKVDIHQGVGRGLTSLDFRDKQPNCDVVTAMDFARSFDLIDAAWRG